MTPRSRFSLRPSLAALVLVAAAPVAALAAHFGALADRFDADLSALAGRASPPADHRALQDYFRTLAARYREQADGHVAMAALYRTTSRLAPVATHCDRLVAQLRAVQLEAQTAAAMHGTLAGAR